MTAMDEAGPEGEPGNGDPSRRDFHRHWAADRVRYGDTDRQGHVNNAVFATFLETGRVNMLFDPDGPMPPPGTSFVIARLVIEFRAEAHWPNEIDIGTTVTRLGRSSLTLSQGLFTRAECFATSESVIVLTDDATRRSCPFPDGTRRLLEPFMP